MRAPELLMGRGHLQDVRAREQVPKAVKDAERASSADGDVERNNLHHQTDDSKMTAH